MKGSKYIHREIKTLFCHAIVIYRFTSIVFKADFLENYHHFYINFNAIDCAQLMYWKFNVY